MLSGVALNPIPAYPFRKALAYMLNVYSLPSGLAFTVYRVFEAKIRDLFSPGRMFRSGISILIAPEEDIPQPDSLVT